MSAVVKNVNKVCRIGWALLILLAGCTKPKDAEAIVGTYAADYEIASEKLVLNNDGTFQQKVELKQSHQTTTASGTWTYDSKRGYITLDGGFMLVIDGLHNFDPNYMHPKIGRVMDSVQKVFGKITIGSADRVVYKRIAERSDR